MDSASDPKRIDRVMLACVQCRNRHVRCDSTQPTCNRCNRDGKDCTYQKSRRGGLDKAALAQRRQRLQQEAERRRQNEDVNRSNSDLDTRSSTQSPATGLQSLSVNTAGSHANNVVPVVNTPLAPLGPVSFQMTNERLLELFFNNFWPAFPVVLPMHFLQVRRLNTTHGMNALLPVLYWIGSIYAPCTASEPYFEAAIAAVGVSSLAHTPFNVQALMLYAIALYHHDVILEARQKLDLAVTMAIELRMNEKEFARAYGEGYPVLEETWRRTYYILKIADQNFAIINNIPIFTLLTIPNRVDLPCDDEDFESGQIPPPMSWADYENREFAEVEVVYSSITYLYDLAMTVAYIMDSFILSGNLWEQVMDGSDMKVAIWSSLLPSCKKDPLRADGKVDEVMFMAHMLATMIGSTTHRPCSTLAYSQAEMSTKSFLTPAPFMLPAKSSRSAHTIRTLKAGEAFMKLLSIPCSIERHNIFTMSMSAQLAAVQISACTNLLGEYPQSVARDGIKIALGFLNTMGSLWPIAKIMASEVRTIARTDLTNIQRTTSLDSASATRIDATDVDAVWPIENMYTGIMIPTEWHAGILD